MEIKNIDSDLLKTLTLPDWSEDADKGTRGKLLLIAGSRRIVGAAILAARAALRSGCGSVRVAAPEGVAIHIGIAVPELMIIPLPETAEGTISTRALDLIIEQSKPSDAIVLGPGLDESEETLDFCREVIASAPLPMVVDAQALPALGEGAKRKAPRIITPHQTEYEALTGETLADTAAREASVLPWAKKSGVVTVLKGRETLIATPEGEIYRNLDGNRGLGTAGSGDVLAGVIGGLLAQGIDPAISAIWGVHMHALAGDAVAKDWGEDGLLARDFIDRLPGIQKYLRRNSAPRSATGFGLRHS